MRREGNSHSTAKDAQAASSKEINRSTLEETGRYKRSASGKSERSQLRSPLEPNNCMEVKS